VPATKGTGKKQIRATFAHDRRRMYWLETDPKKRGTNQMHELLNEIHDIHHPVIVAGDLNSTGSNGPPTSIEKCSISATEVWISGQRKAFSGRRELA